MTISAILNAKKPDLITVTAGTSIEILVHKLAAAGIGAAPVLNADGQVIGIISERDIVRGMLKHGAELGQARVGDLMSANVHTCTVDASVADAMRLMTVHRIRHLPVVEKGKLVGIVSIGDVVKDRLQDIELEANVLRDALIASH